MDAKKAVIGLLVVFLGFWMFTDPNGLASVGRDGAAALWDVVVSFFDAIITFVKEL
jgi:hypothetical protein